MLLVAGRAKAIVCRVRECGMQAGLFGGVLQRSVQQPCPIPGRILRG